VGPALYLLRKMAMSMLGGGGNKCTICTKTCYPAETISFEKKPYHVDCFRCQGETGEEGKTCNKKMEGPSKASAYDDKIYCKQCFQKGGFAQKQRNVKWTKGASSGSASTSSKFGGGGTKCKVCDKTVFQAEAVSYEKQSYHAECFTCTHETDGVACARKMKVSDAKIFDEKLYCSKCFESGGYRSKQAKVKKTTSTTSNALSSRFGGGGTKCEVCAKTVYAAETVAYEKKAYHPQCFTCTHVTEAGVTCAKKLTPSGAKILEAKLYCDKCWESGGYRQKQSKLRTGGSGGGGATTDSRFSKFGGGGNKCERCDKTVYPAETIQYEKKFFHQACFTCEEETCQKKLTPSSAEYNKKNDSIHCKACFQAKGLHLA